MAGNRWHTLSNGLHYLDSPGRIPPPAGATVPAATSEPCPNRNGPVSGFVLSQVVDTRLHNDIGILVIRKSPCCTLAGLIQTAEQGVRLDSHTGRLEFDLRILQLQARLFDLSKVLGIVRPRPRFLISQFSIILRTSGEANDGIKLASSGERASASGGGLAVPGGVVELPIAMVRGSHLE
jgi:hypothetical protein